MEGQEVAVNWRFREGFLEMELEEWRSRQLIDILSDQVIRKYARQENATSGDFQIIHRTSRMCYELATENRITMIDYGDGGILYSIRLNENTAWLNKILNSVRFKLRKTNVSVVISDNFAKSIDNVMSS
jgi:hypothetical protein